MLGIRANLARRKIDGKLTKKQLIFARNFARTGDGIYAAERAGYAEPRVAAWHCVRNEGIMSKVDLIRMAEDILAEGLPLVAQEHVNRLTAEGTDKATNREFAQLAAPLYKYGGLSERRDQVSKELHELTRDELKAQLDQVELELSDRAIDVTPTDDVFG